MKTISALGLLLAASTIATGAAQAKQGDILVRARAIYVMPQEKSGGVLPAMPNERVSVNNTITPEVDFTYMLSDNVGLELIAGTSRHTVSGETPGLAKIGPLVKTNVLPPTLTLQYHFAPEAAFRPYAGVGVNYTAFFATDATKQFEAVAGKTDVSMKSSFGWAAQLGADIPINDKAFINFDAKYIKMDTTATLKTTNLGTQKVNVDLNPIVIGVGIGTKF